MKNNSIIQFISVLIMGLICLFIGPWYIAPVLLFFFGIFLFETKTKALIIGGGGLLLVWMLAATFNDSGNHVNVADMMSQVIGGIHPTVVYLLSGLTVGLTGGLFALTGRLVAGNKT